MTWSTGNCIRQASSKTIPLWQTHPAFVHQTLRRSHAGRGISLAIVRTSVMNSSLAPGTGDATEKPAGAYVTLAGPALRAVSNFPPSARFLLCW
jgi:hypothetical protein